MDTAAARTNRRVLGIACLAAALFMLPPVAASAAPASAARRFDSLALSPDGRLAATVQRRASQGSSGPSWLVIQPLGGGAPVTVPLPCRGAGCSAAAPAWSPDGRRLVFVLSEPGDENRQSLFETDRSGRAPIRLLRFSGVLDAPRFGPHGQLAVLAVAHPHKKTGATKPAAAMTGEIGGSVDEQRIALVQPNRLRFVSPASLFVYEYDWRPDGSGFVATAAPGDGDANWWVAKLHALAMDGADTVLFAPPRDLQLADPVVSPDGRQVAFIGGLMSDFGATGGDAFLLPLDRPGQPPQNLTPSMPASATDLSWHCQAPRQTPGLSATVLHDDHFELRSLLQPSAHPADHPAVLWSGGPEEVSRGGWNEGIACAGNVAATIQQDFTHAPALAAAAITPEGVGAFSIVPGQAPGPAGPEVAVRSLHWRSDQWSVQGWLLQPRGGSAGGRPLIVDVHGGPSSANVPAFPATGFLRALLDAGFDVLLPNPRGSFGEGEAFAKGDIGDLGHGPLRDILAGVDAVPPAADPSHPVDPDRLGLFGYSYGGYMAMWAPTETNRFRAVVSGGGVSDWLSIEGEQGTLTADIPFFGVSVYDRPQPYLDASPIMHIASVHTPVFEFVGERDLECPMAQSQEYATALKALGVPTEFVVYAGQGHGLADPADEKDAQARTVAWFRRWFAAPLPATRSRGNPPDVVQPHDAVPHPGP